MHAHHLNHNYVFNNSWCVFHLQHSCHWWYVCHLQHCLWLILFVSTICIIAYHCLICLVPAFVMMCLTYLSWLHHLQCYTSLISIFNTMHNCFIMSLSSATLHFTHSSWVKSSATAHDTDLLCVCHLQCNAMQKQFLFYHLQTLQQIILCMSLIRSIVWLLNSYCLPCGTLYLMVISHFLWHYTVKFGK